MSSNSEFLNIAIESMIEENSRRSIFNRLFSYISILTAILSAAALITIVIADPTDEKYFNKDNLKKLITQAVKNGASIDNIKHIYDARLLEKKPFYLSFFKTYYQVIIQIVISKLILYIYTI